jgi:predicted RNA binding protein YcfA (HicA-like mRNA interferase family)
LRLPREVSGDDLAQRLAQFGYVVTRQSGSHMRLSTDVGGRHRLTIPRHPTLRIGTLSGIVAAVAKHHGLSREILVARLFR